MTVKDIISAALELPPEERSEVADILLRSLDSDETPQPSEEWIAEINRRVEDVRSGRVELIPADVALAQIRAGLARAD